MTFISQVRILLSAAFIFLSPTYESFAFNDGPISLDIKAMELRHFSEELATLKEEGIDIDKIIGIGKIGSCGQERFTLVSLDNHKIHTDTGKLLQYLVVHKKYVKIIGLFEDYYTKDHDQICSEFINEHLHLYRDGIKYTLYRVNYLNYYYLR